MTQYRHRVLAVIIAAVTAVTISGCTHTVYVRVPATTTPTTESVDPVATPEDTFDYQSEDPTITLKTTSKACFGDAGCNLVVKPVLTIDDPESVPGGVTGSITYEIDGGSDGPVVDTLELTGGQYQATESVIQTTTANSKLVVKVTDVETDPQ